LANTEEPEEPEEGIDESQAVNSRSLFNNKTLDIYIHSSSVPTQVSLKEAYKRKLDKLVAHQRELTAKFATEEDPEVEGLTLKNNDIYILNFSRPEE